MRINDIVLRLKDKIPKLDAGYGTKVDIQSISVLGAEVTAISANHGLASPSDIVTIGGIKQEYVSQCVVIDSYTFNANFPTGHNFHKGEQIKIEADNTNYYEIEEIKKNDIIFKGNLTGEIKFYKEDTTNFNGQKLVTIIDKNTFKYDLIFTDISTVFSGSFYLVRPNIFGFSSEKDFVDGLKEGNFTVIDTSVNNAIFVVVKNATCSINNFTTAVDSSSNHTRIDNFDRIQSFSIYVYARNNSDSSGISTSDKAINSFAMIYKSIAAHRFVSPIINNKGVAECYKAALPTNDIYFFSNKGKEYIRQFDFKATVKIESSAMSSFVEGTALKQINTNNSNGLDTQVNFT